MRERPPTLHWDASNRFENVQRLKWENAAIKSPKTTFFQKQVLTQRGYWHTSLALGAVCVTYPFLYYAATKLFPDTQDFRSQLTTLRWIGGLEEKDYYIVERFKAIERAKAKA
uniref:Transmembrane protein n=1 Tax=Eutreptiella gymnastica TaxID=73025 RepID=A0A7S1N204_9EUGL